MRRIWAHIIIAITAIVMMVVTFASVTNKLNVGMDYANGRTLTFHITEKTDNGENNPKTFEDNDLETIAEKMENRLKAAEVSNFEIAPFGKDLIKVTLYQDSVDYSQIEEYLTFNGSLYLYSYDSDKTEHYVNSKAFVNEENPATLETTNTYYPTINIPVRLDDEDYKAVVTGAVNSDEITTKEESSEGAGDAETARFMYLVYNFVPGRDSFESENFQNLVLLRFEVKTDNADDATKIFDYYVNDDEYALSTVINIGVSESGELNKENLKKAWENGNFYVNLLNAGSYDFDITCINDEQIAPAKVEALYSLGKNQTVFMSATFVTFACCIVLISLVLIAFYKLGALSISVTSLASIFSGILFLMLFKAEFTLISVIGLVLVGIASIASGCIYLNKFKDESYRGRSIKKANTEASKKSTGVTVDIHLALIILGAFMYLIGGVEMKSFALVTVLAGIVSLLLNLIAFKGFMWLDTNASAAQGKYGLFGVEETKVPNLSKEEKQAYFGPYQDRDFTKKSKLSTIITGIAFVATLAGLITFGCVKGSSYNNPVKECTPEIFIKIDNEESVDLSSISANIEGVLKTISSDAAGQTKLFDSFGSIEHKDFDILEYDSDETTPYFMHCYEAYFIQVNKELPENIYFEGTQYKTADFFSSENETVFRDAIGNSDAIKTIEFAKGSVSSKAKPEVGRIAIATGAALLTTTLYLLLRYKLSRGLASLITTLAGATFVGGLFSLLYFVPVTNTAVIGLAVGEFLCLVFAIMVMNKERDMILDDRKHDNSYENRNEIMKKSIAYGFGDNFIVFIVAVVVGILAVCLGPNSMMYISIEICIASVVAFALAEFVLGPVSQFFFKRFTKVGEAKPKKSKSRGPVKNKSAEPEEAIFIGIND